MVASHPRRYETAEIQVYTPDHPSSNISSVKGPGTVTTGINAGTGVRREKAATFQWVKGPPGDLR